MNNDGWKFAEQLLGITAEALKRAREGAKFPTVAVMRQHAAAGTCPGCDGRNGEHWDLCGVLEAERRGAQHIENKIWDALPAGQRGHVGLKHAIHEVSEAVADAKKWREREKTATDIERLVRGQVADRLTAILFPGPARPNWALDEALAEVERRVGALRTPLDTIKAEARDAALDEADRAIRCFAAWERCDVPHCPACNSAARIRALKSKPAQTATVFVESKGLHSNPIPKGPEVVARGVTFDGGELKPAPVQCLVPGCDRPHQHEGPHAGGAPAPDGQHYGNFVQAVGRLRSEAMQSQPVVHDFGWALAQMRAGKRVRIASWRAEVHLELQPKCHAIALCDDGLFVGWSATSETLLATDWEVVE